MSLCKCFDQLRAKVTDHLKEQLPHKEAESLKASWTNEALVMGDGEMTTMVGVPVSYEYQKLKKSGEPHKNLTRGEVKMMMSYCPFCGANLKGEQGGAE